MEEVAELDVWDVAGRLVCAIRQGDIDDLRVLCDPEFWDRAGEAELTGLARDVTAASLLGALGRRTLFQVESAGAAVARHVVEQQWIQRPGGPLVEDERLFTLADRAAIETSGDTERLERMATKLAAQDAAVAYAAALRAGDPVAVSALWSSRFADAHGAEVLPRVASVAGAELIGSVGPRTLVRVWYTGSDETVELLWRPHGDRWLVEGARTFRRPEQA